MSDNNGKKFKREFERDEIFIPHSRAFTDAHQFTLRQVEYIYDRYLEYFSHELTVTTHPFGDTVRGFKTFLLRTIVDLQTPAQ